MDEFTLSSLTVSITVLRRLLHNRQFRMSTRLPDIDHIRLLLMNGAVIWASRIWILGLLNLEDHVRRVFSAPSVEAPLSHIIPTLYEFHFGRNPWIELSFAEMTLASDV